MADVSFGGLVEDVATKLLPDVAPPFTFEIRGVRFHIITILIDAALPALGTGLVMVAEGKSREETWNAMKTVGWFTPLNIAGGLLWYLIGTGQLRKFLGMEE